MHYNQHMRNFTKSRSVRHTSGFTLVELMIVIGILSIIAAIAIPTYNGYVREARITSARINIEPLRLALEDFWLDNGAFVEGEWIPSGTQTLAASNVLSWRPDGDGDKYDYSVSFVGGSTQVVNITVTHKDQTDEPQWIIVNRIP